MFGMMGLGPAELIVLVVASVLTWGPLVVGAFFAWRIYQTKRGPDVCPHCGAKLREP